MSLCMNTATLRPAICSAIVTKIEDPALWMLAVRRVATALDLDLAQCIVLGVTLNVAVHHVLENAEKRRRTDEQVTAAMASI